MKLLKKLLSILFLTVAILSKNAVAAETCLSSYLGYKFQIAQIDDEQRATCIYSASAIYDRQGRFKPILKPGSRWKWGHGGWYCRPTSASPKACQFRFYR